MCCQPGDIIRTRGVKSEGQHENSEIMGIVVDLSLKALFKRSPSLVEYIGAKTTSFGFLLVFIFRFCALGWGLGPIYRIVFGKISCGAHRG